MTDPNNTVFISYRRSNSKYLALLLFKELTRRGYDVFFDIESIDSGAFESVILNQIAARTHFVVLLAEGTLDRCSEPGDWLRQEIEHAMGLERNIVPVMVEDFKFNTVQQHLTGKLSHLPRYNGLKLYYEYFDAAVENLCNRYLQKPEYPVVIQAIPAAEQNVIQRKIEEANSLPVPTPEELLEEQLFNWYMARDEVSRLNMIIEDHPDDARLFCERGEASRQMDDLSNAVNDFTTAIRLNPEYADAYELRGKAYFLLGQFEYARHDFKTARRLKPSDPSLLISEAISLHGLEQIQKAKELWLSLSEQDRRYEDWDWVEKKIRYWPEPMIQEARKLIARL
jgi:tetratricopeptide (TPR) repeat protein